MVGDEAEPQNVSTLNRRPKMRQKVDKLLRDYIKSLKERTLHDRDGLLDWLSRVFRT